MFFYPSTDTNAIVCIPTPTSPSTSLDLDRTPDPYDLSLLKLVYATLSSEVVESMGDVISVDR